MKFDERDIKGLAVDAIFHERPAPPAHSADWLAGWNAAIEAAAQRIEPLHNPALPLGDAKWPYLASLIRGVTP